jgi:hypothetical protein
MDGSVVFLERGDKETLEIDRCDEGGYYWQHVTH